MPTRYASDVNVRHLFCQPLRNVEQPGVLQIVTEAWQTLLSSPCIKHKPQLGVATHALHSELLRAVGAPVDTLAASVTCHAAALRKAGRLPEAMRHHLDLHTMMAQSTGATVYDGCRRGFPLWRVEEAKLLWAMGKQRLAVGLLERLSGSHTALPNTGASVLWQCLRLPLS
jgi:hypothetical protein